MFAATTPMQGVIAHGMLSLNLIWQTLRASLGDVGAHTNLDVRFVKPDEIVISGMAEVRTPA